MPLRYSSNDKRDKDSNLKLLFRNSNATPVLLSLFFALPISFGRNREKV